MDDEDADKVVNWKALKEQFGIPYTRTHSWRKMAAGTFPQSFKLGPYDNSPPVWWVREIRKWLRDHTPSK